MNIKKTRIFVVTASLLSMLGHAEASNLKKIYVNIAKEGQQAQVGDIPANYGTIDSKLKTFGYDALGHHGLFNGGTAIGLGKIGTGVTLGGINQMDVRVAQSPAFYSSPSFSVALWVNMDASTKGTYATPLMNRWETTISPGIYKLYGYNIYKGTNDAWQFWIGPGDNVPGWSTVGTGSNEVKFGKWTHIAGTYNGTTMTLYVNGEKIGTRNTVYVPNTSNAIYMGTANGGWPMKGQLDEVSIWNRELSQDEVEDLMSEPPRGGEAGLVGYWGFN